MIVEDPFKTREECRNHSIPLRPHGELKYVFLQNPLLGIPIVSCATHTHTKREREGKKYHPIISYYIKCIIERIRFCYLRTVWNFFFFFLPYKLFGLVVTYVNVRVAHRRHKTRDVASSRHYTYADIIFIKCFSIVFGNRDFAKSIPNNF